MKISNVQRFLTGNLIILFVVMGCNSNTEKWNPTIISSDITNFWNAYDAISASSDSSEQLQFLKSEFLDKASSGQLRMMEARRYTADDYLNEINQYPNFWKSLRNNTLQINRYKKELEDGVHRLKQIYPDLTSSNIYFTMGAHRSAGTGVDSLVLIGTEYALGDLETNTSELPDRIQSYYETNPTAHMQFLIVHEYVHTQQNAMVHNLLSLSLYEGIADFVSEIATERKSPFDAFTYGPENEANIKKRFEQDMFVAGSQNGWLWNSSRNEFGTRDLGYFVGYSIAKSFYDQHSDKHEAIRSLITLNYEEESEVEELVDGTGYFSDSLETLYQNFESSRPQVLDITPLTKMTEKVDPGITRLTLIFSEPMNTESRGFDLGPLGVENVLRAQQVIGWSEDRKSFTFEVSLKPDKRYQSLATNRFLSETGIPLKPFLIDFTTDAK